uniref:Ig-like domain-containing protein n=1 Tax=Sinocyclocheilus anshuiensis TaxID=1608454 RepID=A0A671Q532_9TELE
QKSVRLKQYVSSAQDRIEQSSGEMTESEGAQVILMCNYTTTSTTNYLFWYKQLPNRSPTFILNQYTTEFFTTRFSATLDSTSRIFPLMIEDVHVSDSAVYYCALRPTVTGNTRTLYKNLTQMKVYNQFFFYKYR